MRNVKKRERKDRDRGKGASKLMVSLPPIAMIIPTTYPALHDPVAYPNPESFNPDRWGPEGHAEKYPKNFMVFGNGPHHCLGKEYAIMHLMAIIAQASLQLEWTHYRTEKSDDIS